MKTIHLLLTGLALPIASQAASLVDLNFNSLPSAQGFTYSQSGPHADDSEASQFSVNGSSLSQITVGNGQNPNSPGSALYRRDFTTSETLGTANFRFEMTASVSAHEQTRQDFSYAGFFQSTYINSEGILLGIKPNEIHINGTYFTPTGFDGTLTHNYRVDVDLEANQFELFLDGTSVRTGATSNFSGNYFSFGDGTGTANANGQISKLAITTNIPEPSSTSLLALASAGLLLRRRA